jgi:predicted CXXCH cytochrome family protein
VKNFFYPQRHSRLQQSCLVRSGQKQTRPKLKYVVGCALLLSAAVASWILFRSPRASESAKHGESTNSRAQSDAELFASYGKSPSCKSCHEEAFALWQNSHHARAEQAVNLDLDSGAFDPARLIQHGTQTTKVRRAENKLQFIATGVDGQTKAFAAERVIGVDPLKQFLIPAAGGRWQAMELAFDPKLNEWFDIFGAEDRRPGEWGHWTGRGMTWNAMCAVCHNTRVRKNYDFASDTYSTTMAEAGVACEQCHGPMGDHNAWQSKHPKQSGDPTVRRVNREQMFSVCGTCHSRRAELTGDFKPGDSYFDHYSLTIPDETELFYADGQIREEDYEFTSFLGSKMSAAGVRCGDCHEPHSSKTRVAGNLLCMSCHGAVTNAAPKIDLATHSHHKIGERGDFCVDCHMPQTTFMQRHGRHDHGFTIPDPLLTKEVKIPNACDRCHADKGGDWTLNAVRRWYGEKMNRSTRTNAQMVVAARASERKAVDGLLRMLSGEKVALWRAVAANLLKRWPDDPKVTAALLSACGDTNALVRAMAVRGLEPLVQTRSQPVQTALQGLLSDPVSAIRVEAAWALRHTIDLNSQAASDLLRFLRFNEDQPSGALQLGVFYLDRGDLPAAMNRFERALKWDANSAPLYHAYAVALSMQGKSAEAVDALQTACRLAPNDAEYRFELGLALNEVGKLPEAQNALEQAVKLDPQFTQAWYNLGLALSALNQPEAALQSLARAESLDGRSAQIPYARATILARIGRVEEARNSARRALEIQPTHPEAIALLRELQ